MKTMCGVFLCMIMNLFLTDCFLCCGTEYYGSVFVIQQLSSTTHIECALIKWLEPMC